MQKLWRWYRYKKQDKVFQETERGEIVDANPSSYKEKIKGK